MLVGSSVLVALQPTSFKDFTELIHDADLNCPIFGEFRLEKPSCTPDVVNMRIQDWAEGHTARVQEGGYLQAHYNRIYQGHVPER
jgi:hypothetical protein